VKNTAVAGWLLIGLGFISSACVMQEPTAVPAPPLERPQFVSTVISVLDGDTVVVNRNDKADKVRLVNIDCPESDQSFGPQATQLAKQLALDKAVTVTDFGRDKYQRLLGELILPDGRVLNRELVREGFCWWYRRYAPANMELERLEREAKDAKRGLWADPAPIPPWEWRKRKE